MARAMLTLFVDLFSSSQHIFGPQQRLAKQMEELLALKFGKTPQVFSILFKPIVGSRWQNLGGTDMYYFAGWL